MEAALVWETAIPALLSRPDGVERASGPRGWQYGGSEVSAPDPGFPGPSKAAAAQQASQPDYRRRRRPSDRPEEASVRDVRLGCRAGKRERQPKLEARR